ncbi:MAG: bifunctional metallophosphatase/5'-nucleotidase [Lachnospiraceae bacterium]|nr:bifunctional metallophosphatase/5'-nucleotidase [Lachnospiraceae bacterium]
MKKRVVTKVLAALTAISTLMLTGCSPELMMGYYQMPQEQAAEEAAPAEAPAEEAAATEEEPVFEGPQDIMILFTSDIHCGVDQGLGLDGVVQIRETLEKQGNLTLLVDNGDSVQGEPIGTVTSGEAVIDLMNDAGYDIGIPGNHDFDYGIDQFFALTERANFPYLSCNFNKEGELVLPPYLIKEIGDHKIGFVGVTTPRTLVTSTPKYFQDADGNFIYGFMQDSTGQGVYDAVQKAVDDARADGADYVILMGHIGNEQDMAPYTCVDILSNTTGIDAMVDGHSHDTEQMTVKNKDGEDVPRSACGTKLSGLGYVKISAEDGSVSTGLYSWGNKESPAQLFGYSNAMQDNLEEATVALNEELSVVVAQTAVDLTINDPVEVDAEGHPIRLIRRMETNLGDLCADAYREQLETDVALINGGGIRATIEKGDITLADILKVHPFGNMASVYEVTGQMLLDALEWGARVTPDELGGFLQVSGMSYEIHTYIDTPCITDENGMFAGIEGERRVQNVMVGDEPIDPDKTYTLASIDYIIKDHGDGFAMFDDAETVLDGIKIDNQMLIDYIVDYLGGMVGENYEDPYGQGRIVEFEEAP